MAAPRAPARVSAPAMCCSPVCPRVSLLCLCCAGERLIMALREESQCACLWVWRARGGDCSRLTCAANKHYAQRAATLKLTDAARMVWLRARMPGLGKHHPSPPNRPPHGCHADTSSLEACAPGTMMMPSHRLALSDDDSEAAPAWNGAGNAKRWRSWRPLGFARAKQRPMRSPQSWHWQSHLPSCKSRRRAARCFRRGRCSKARPPQRVRR